MVKNNGKQILAFIFLFFLGSADLLWAQEQGNLFISNYTVKDYEGHAQNFDVVLDNDGLLYLGNTAGGVKVYDGKVWQSIASEKKEVHCLDKGASGIIYVGLVNDFGFIQKNKNQKAQYHSLAPYLDEKHKTIGSLWHIHSIGDTAYFFSNDFIYIWSNGKMEYVDLEKRFYRQFLVNNIIYLNNRQDLGIYKLVGNQPVKVELDKKLIHKVIVEMLPYDENHILIISRYEGLFLFNPTLNTLVPLEGDITPRLQQDRINCAINLQNGDIALGSSFSGAMVMDKQANLVRSFDKSNGLSDLTIWNMHEDDAGNIWMANNNGLSKVEHATGLDYWDESSGVSGAPLSIKRVNNRLYVSTTVGLFYLENNAFQKVEGINGFCNNLVNLSSETGDKKEGIVGTDRGIFKFSGNIGSLFINENPYLLYQYQKDANYLFMTDYSGGVLVYFFDGNKWKKQNAFPELTDKGVIPTSLAEDVDGHLWFGTEASGVYRMENPMSKNQVKFTSFGFEQGLPKQTAYSVTQVDNQILLYSQKGFFKWLSQENRFGLDTAFCTSVGLKNPSTSIYPFYENENGDLWFYSNNKPDNQIIGAIKNKSGDKYTIDSIGARRIQPNAVSTIYSEPNGNVWVGVPGKIYRYQPKKAAIKNRFFNSVINKINIKGDSTFFYGNITSGDQQDQVPVFQYANNFIRFTFGATSYAEESKTQFSFRLQGYNEQWSPWSFEGYKEFTNLKEGIYTFELKAKNIYGEQSEICDYTFEITPPWFRTSFAYLAYMILGVFFISLIVRFYNQRLKKENEHLETLVHERTKEIENNNTQLKETIDKLTTTQSQLIQSEKMASLGQLTAGIAHEINNPINFISSSTEALKLDFHDVQKILALFSELKEGEISAQQIRKFQQLKKEIDLDFTISEMTSLLNGIEEGSNRTQEIVKGLRIFSRNTSESFHSANVEEGIDSTLLIINHQISEHIEVVKNYGKTPLVNCQISKLNQVFLNLIANAIHAIESRQEKNRYKGKIVISTRQIGEMVEVRIQDNGIGMTEDIRQKIFEPFFTTKAVGKGTGLGLSVSYGIIEEHQGTIEVKSTPESGTEFIINVPVKPKDRDEG